MKLERTDFFQPLIVPAAILVFLLIGYIGSFNYRFEDCLDLGVILTVLFSCAVFTAGVLLVRYRTDIKNTREFKLLSEKLLIAIIALALILQSLNMILLGGIPLFNSVLKANATTNLWRIAYPLFLIAINVLLAKYYRKRYLIFVLLGALVFGLNGYRTSVLGILGSVFITLFYLGRINRKIAVPFIILVIIAGLAVGYIASQSIANQHWTLNPIELVFYRFAFTLEVFERILPLQATTKGKILAMIFSSGSPRTFIGQYVLHDNVCLTSTIFGPVYLDFGLIGLTVQMFFMGAFLELLSKLKKGVGTGIYSIVVTHTLIWIETGPTDIMIWFFYLLGLILIILNKN